MKCYCYFHESSINLLKIYKSIPAPAGSFKPFLMARPLAFRQIEAAKRRNAFTFFWPYSIGHYFSMLNIKWFNMKDLE